MVAYVLGLAAGGVIVLIALLILVAATLMSRASSRLRFRA
jgi:hypothetical protein